MKIFKSTQWPSKRLVFITVLNFIVQLSCIPFFPLVSPCHWSVEGIANGYMNKYLYVLYYLLPFLVLWIFGRKPQNQIISFFYTLTLGRIVRYGIVVLTVLATWIPAYVILFVPNVIPLEQQSVWISGMVYVVEIAVDISIVLVLLSCIVMYIKSRVHS